MSVQQYPPASAKVYSGFVTVPTHGTAVQVSTSHLVVQRVYLFDGATAGVYVGGPNVSAAAGSEVGVRLSSTDPLPFEHGGDGGIDLFDLWVDAVIDNTRVTWLAFA